MTVILTISSVFETHLIEILLSIILMFNVGAYTFLWRKVWDIEKSVEENEDNIQVMFKRMFGVSEDETDEGHLVETRHEFKKIDERFDEIEDKIDIIESNNRQSHEEVRAMIQQMIALLDKEEEIEFEEENMKRFR